jgi:predicted nucleic acid-binding protein
MGVVRDELERARIVCLDTAPIIYFIENSPEFAPLVAPVVRDIDAGRRRGVSSIITLIEVLVKPLRLGRVALADAYRRRLLGQPNLQLLDLAAPIAERAAEIRARHNFKVPDSIQLATAVHGGADLFLTNDHDLARFTEIRVMTLAELAH